MMNIEGKGVIGWSAGAEVNGMTRHGTVECIGPETRMLLFQKRILGEGFERENIVIPNHRKG